MKYLPFQFSFKGKIQEVKADFMCVWGCMRDFVAHYIPSSSGCTLGGEDTGHQWIDLLALA